MLHITLDSAIRFRFDPAQEVALAEAIKADTTLPNPEFANRKRMGLYLGGVSETLKFRAYDRVTQETTLPRGYLERLKAHLGRLGYEYQVEDRRVLCTPVPFHSRICFDAKPYQVPAVETITVNHEQGLLVAGCGAGKTVMMMEIIARFGQPALIVVHTVDLAEQAIQTAELIGVERDEIGYIGGGRCTVGPRLTVALVQSLTQSWDRIVEKHPDILARFGLVALDEAHHAPAKTFTEAITRFPARYRFGMTATPDRKDGLGPAMLLCIGPIRYTVPRAEVDAAGGTMLPKLVVVRYAGQNEAWNTHRKAMEEHQKTVAALPPGARVPREPRKPRIDFNKVAADIFTNADRNAVLVESIGQNARGHVSLVLSERVEHCQLLRDLLVEKYPGLRAAVIHGKQSKDVRAAAIQDARDGRLDVLLAVDVAKEGLDVPRLDRLHLVAGGKDPNELKQKIGRIMRTCPGKADAVVYDYVDTEIGVLQAQYYQRCRVYRELGMMAARATKKAG